MATRVIYGVVRVSCNDLRLHIAVMMEMAMGEALCLMGVCCSTYVAVNRGTSQRCDFLPQGNMFAMSVYKANKMMSRPEPVMPQCVLVEPELLSTQSSPNHAELQVRPVISIGNLPGNRAHHRKSWVDLDPPTPKILLVDTDPWCKRIPGHSPPVIDCFSLEYRFQAMVWLADPRYSSRHYGLNFGVIRL